ncbi:MAG: CPBP family intramembrane metalloprotease, partial [Chloroflexota bacterium]|nr:CPBP family intramembrane metalloprotease [Chloroflexota bacterium]
RVASVEREGFPATRHTSLVTLGYRGYNRAMQTNEPQRDLPTLPTAPPFAAPWGLRDLLFGILAAAGGILIINLPLVAAALLGDRTLAKNGIVLAVFVALQDLVIVGAAALFSVVRYRVAWDRLGWRAFNAPFGCGLSAGLFILSYAVRFCYGLAASAFGYQPALQDVLTRLDATGFGFVLTLVAAAVVAPIAEETFFRGFVYGGLRGRIGVIGAMVVSTLFFTALHFSIDQFIPIFFLGLFLAFLYEKTGSLYPGILLHATNNAISLVVFALLSASGNLPIR